VLVAGLAGLAYFPWADGDVVVNRFERAVQMGARWWVLWVLIAGSIGYRCVLAIQRPVAARVQVAVKHALVSLIVIDAIVTFAGQGLYPWSLAILALMVPTVVIGRWIYST
jgi:hypothetical protein